MNRHAYCESRRNGVMNRAIAYYRVSTVRQGRSGLGLEAQQKSVTSFASANQLELITEYIETESGKRNERQGLLTALKECKQQNATLLIAKLDRLSRRVSFIATLMDSGVDFKVVDNPYAEAFTLHVLAAVAQKEREDISNRTRAALAAAKERGVTLGKHCKNVLSKENKQSAIEFAKKMKPIIDEIKKSGVKSIRGIVDELNKMNVPTYRNDNSKWHNNTVHTLLKRQNKT